VSTKHVPICDCGWQGSPTTPARVSYSFRQHSCARQAAKDAKAENGRAIAARIDHTPKPCHHKQVTHVHGTRACYVLDKCRCIPCGQDRARWERASSRAKAYGRWDNLVDATPAREHVAALAAQGMGLKRIVAVSDVSQGLLWKLVYGKRHKDGSRIPSVRITKSANQRILALRLDLADGARIDSTGTSRRIQALVAIGWSQSKIAARLGILRSNFTAIAQGRTDVTVTRAKAVADLYDQLWDQTPPHVEWRAHIAYSRSLSYSAKAGWVVPMAWDEDTIDNPDTTPDLGQASPLSGRPNKFSIEDIDFILDNDPLTIDQLADRLHVTRDTIEHRLARSDRRDLLARMIRNKTVQENAA
jgi:transcriptional regulator with XRE-family HTH domain